MNYDGEHLINYIVRRLEKKNIRCYDSAIRAEIAGLNHNELTEILTFDSVINKKSQEGGLMFDRFEKIKPDIQPWPYANRCEKCGWDDVDDVNKKRTNSYWTDHEDGDKTICNDCKIKI